MVKLLSLFGGIGADIKALKNLGEEVKTIDYVEWKANRVKAYNAMNPFRYKTQDVRTWDLKPDILVHGSPCFLAGELVNTTNGLKPIEQIKCGDKVISHDGSINKVYETFISENNQMVNLKAAPVHLIRTTANHPFYVNRKGINQWVMANDLTTEDFLTTPINKRQKMIDWQGVELHYNNNTEVSKKLPLNEIEFWYVVGRFIGDGWITKRKERNNNISGIKICCAHNELDSLLPSIEKFFKTTVIKERSVYKLKITNKELGVFCQMFGEGAGNKHIPQKVLDIPNNFLKELVRGILESDGCETKNQIKLTSISEKLVYSLGEAMLKTHKKPYRIYKTERPKTRVLEGRLINQKDTYQLVMAMGNYYKRLQYVDDDYMYSRIRKIEHYDELNKVYNIEVEKTHSYCVKNIATHNCQDNSAANLNDDQGRSQLMLETLRIIRGMGEWRPSIVIWENVKGALFKKKRPIFDKYLREMESMGYTNSWEVLQSMDFGIPQSRERLFCISIMGNAVFDFAKLKKRPMRPLEEFLQPESEINLEKYIVNVPSMLNRLADLAKPEDIEANKNKFRYIETVNSYFWTLTERPDRCPGPGVIKTSDGRYRYPTEREYWRLMGFDDADFDLMLQEFPIKSNTRSATLYALAGNSIVVQVLEAVFEVILNKDYSTDFLTENTGQLQLIC